MGVGKLSLHLHSGTEPLTFIYVCLCAVYQKVIPGCRKRKTGVQHGRRKIIHRVTGIVNGATPPEGC